MANEDIYDGSTSFDRLGDVVAPSDLFDREYGAQLTQWELKLHCEFMERISSRIYRFVGFVHYTRNRDFFILTPSPWTHNGVVIFVPDEKEVPPDGARIELIGRRIANPRVLERSSTNVQAFALEDWSSVRFDVLQEVDPPLSLAELSRMLFEHVGMAETSKRVFARLFISSPPFESGVGGLTTGIQAIAAKAQVRRFLTFIRRILPPVLRGKVPKYRNVGGHSILTRRTWRLDVGELARDTLQTLCIERKDPSGFKEVSLSAMTTQATGALPDVPLALTSEDFWIETRNSLDLRLPILKTVITAQMLIPMVGERTITAGTKYIIVKMQDLKDSFDLDDSVLSRGMILDSDMLGRPLSTVRIARSTARASWKSKITAKDIKTAWDRVLEPALKEYLELTQFKEQARHNYGEDAKTHKFNTKVWRALKKLDSGTLGDLGPTVREIAEEAGVDIPTTSRNLELMKNAGVVYEPRPGHFRLV